MAGNEMVGEIIEDMKAHCKEAITALSRELAKLRTGRANPAILDHIRVDYYGQPTPINKLATVTSPEPRLLVIRPWDKTALASIEKAIQIANIGLSPNNDGELIRIPIPQLTEERRKEMAKQVGKMVENAKVSIRNARRDANEMLKSMEKEKELSEDDLHREMEVVQKTADEYIKKAEETGAAKEKDLMEI
ncbi:MAG: ribosome recycling factor [Myxococcota bacterium]